MNVFDNDQNYENMENSEITNNKLDFKFKLGEKVYLKTDESNLPGIVTGYTIRPNNLVTYLISCNSHESRVYDFEIQRDKNIV